ncbi:multisubunit Na+/H+ antiporter MnhF subunit [Desulfitispora alkaliphila]|uniref:Na(+)/H(+) antiporter subunit F1 n=1 Tax=Desulfitispora alkaliphila TaxID=622674 RepID=UPI003D21D5E9
MLDMILNIGMIAVAVSIAACFYRVAVGPSLPDRVIALDTIGINIVAMISLFSLKHATQMYLDVILVIAILAFMGTVAISKFMEEGVIIDRDNS